MNVDELLLQLKNLGASEKAQALQRYFKTGPGEYGEGDLFVGVMVPTLRRLAKEHQALPLQDVLFLLHSPIHEARMLSLLILCRQYGRADAAMKERIYDLYLENTRYINNWDLVDLSAREIVGAHLEKKRRERLRALALSPLVWDRRIAIIATGHFIKLDDFTDTLEIGRILLSDREDLIHKAVGWMLREVGKRDRSIEEEFLRNHYKQMPRTMLRYAVERFPEDLRKEYLRR
jgi:3-methyladenine DNA glycosylase AlkD